MSGQPKPSWSYVLFFTSAAAFRAEKAAAAAGIPDCRLVPTPRELSSDCGAALRFRAGHEAEAARALAAAKVPYDRIESGP